MCPIGNRTQAVSGLRPKMLRCAITPGEGGDTAELAGLARSWAEAGVDFIQLREPPLSAGSLFAAAVAMRQAIAEVVAAAGSASRLLVNHRADVALAAGADGVHLTSRPGELTAEQVRTLFALGRLPQPIVSIAAHTLDDVRRAREQRVDLILFGPVFEKRVHGELVHSGSGLALLRQACVEAGDVPVLALGGVTAGNAPSCLEAGAKGIAAIRLFQAS